MKVVGLTGGIGSGKSLVARLLRDDGVEVVDADAIAREVVRPGSPGLAAVVAAFGSDVLLPDGSLDRKRLGERVFSDPAARAQLNAITHPLIAAETARRLDVLRARRVPFAFYEAALLVENGMHAALDALVVVDTDPAIQRARVMARDGLSGAEAEQRIAAQAPRATRRAVADLILANDGSEAALAAQVAALVARLRQGDALRRAGE